jgi:hypothetical protein
MPGTFSVTSRSFIDYSKGAEAKRCEKITCTFTGDASDGTVPALSLDLRGFLVKVVTNPGSTAPTDNYDITLTDPDAADLDAAGGTLANRDTANSEQVYPLISGAACPIFLAGTYGLTVSNTSVNNATGIIVLYLIDGT